MKSLLYITLITLFANTTLGQSICNFKTEMGTSYKPNRIFNFSNNKYLAIFGTETIENGKTIFSEFALYQCSNTHKVWESDGTHSSTIHQENDTIVLERLYAIPNGENFSIQWLGFFITKFHFIDDAIAISSYYQTDTKKYSEAEINLVLTQFESIQEPILDFENYLMVVNRLFWAYVSGSYKAEIYLEKLRNQYGKYDGANSEDFDSLIMTCENYKSTQD